MLLNRPECFSDESISSYLFRVASANHRPISIFITSFRITRAEWLSNMFSDKQLTKLASSLNLIKNNLYQGTYHMYRNLLDNNLDSYLLKNRMKYCPDCLREKAYHRTIWGLKPITICLRHRSRLIDSCTKCQMPVFMDQFMNGFCKRCGYRYYYTKSNLISDDSLEYEFQSDFQEALFQNRGILQNIGGMNAKQFLLLAHRSFYLLEDLTSFLAESNKTIRFFQNRPGGVQLNEPLAEAYNHVYWMYQDFPQHFNLVLEEVLKNRRKRVYDQLKAFEVLFEDPSNEIIRAAYNQFWLKELEKGTVRKDLSVFKRDQELLLAKKHLRLEELKRASLSYPKVKNLTETGIIEMQTLKRGKVFQYFIAKDNVVKFQNTQKKFVTKRKVAEILGIQRESVKQLVAEGFLIEIKLPFNHNSLFSKKRVEKLLESVIGEYKPDSDGITFHNLLMKYSVNGLTISKILRFTQQNLLHPELKVKNGNLASTSYKLEEISYCLELMKKKRREDKGMTLTEVIRYLHIGEAKMKHFMNSGQLVPNKVVTWKDGRQRFYFRQEHVLEFELKDYQLR